MDITERGSLLVIIILLSVLNIILAPLPVNSFVLGIPLILFSFLYLCDSNIKNKPYKFYDKKYACTSWRQHITKLPPFFSKLDKISTSRWKKVFIMESRLINGLSLIILALIIFLPIPFANTPGSIGMISLCLGILQRDGLLLLLGYICFVIHILAILYFSSLLIF